MRPGARPSLIPAMDRKAFIIIFISCAVLVMWMPLTNYLFPPIPAPRSTNQVALQTNVVSTQAVATVPDQPAVIAPAVPLVTAQTPEELIEIETPESRLTFTSHGGGLKRAELKEYPEVIACNDKEVAATNRVELN